MDISAKTRGLVVGEQLKRKLNGIAYFKVEKR
jgi:hypothetical protein